MADYYNSVITKLNTDSNGNIVPKLIQNENIKVLFNGIALLDEFPYKPYGVYISGYTEVSNGTALSATQFFVEYDGAGACKVHFAISEIGKHLTVTYKGLGKEAIIASRIATEWTEDGDIVQTLAEYISNYASAMEANRIHSQVNKYTATTPITTIPYASITGLTWNPAYDNLVIIRDNLQLIENENYSKDGTGITLYESLDTGESIFVTVFRGLLVDVPAPSSDGSLLLPGSVGEYKLEQVVQDKLTLVTTMQGEIVNARSGQTTLKAKIDAMDANITLNTTRISELTVNVKKFGAKGDGTTDDTSAINSAIAYCVANKCKEIFFPPGVYYTTTAIDTQQIKLKGVGNPEIPFLEWEYTRPGSTVDSWLTYKAQCKGSVITTDKAINVFSTGLVAENIGLLGNLRVASGCGISQTDGEGQQIKLNNCVIKGFKQHGVYVPYGSIYMEVIECEIAQNGINGIYIDKNLGTYTGETNMLVISDNKICRNESHGIFANIMGRHTSIFRNDFSANGEPSDEQRTKPTGINDAVFGAVINFYNPGGATNGAFDFSNNYSEETYGLLKLYSANPSYGVKVEHNFWFPYDQTNYSCFTSFSGWISGLSVKRNDMYGTHDIVRFETGNTITNVDIDCYYIGLPKGTNRPNQEAFYTGSGTFTNLSSDDVLSIIGFDAGMATSMTYSSGDGLTYIHINASRSVGTIWDGYDMGSDANNSHSGYAVKVGGTFIGVIQTVSSTNKVISVRGDRSGISLGDGSLEIVRLGGIETISGSGGNVKLVVDWDGTILITGK